jgi:nuclease-like protein
MKVRIWALIAAVLGGLLALVFVFAGEVATGLGMGAATVAGLTTQMSPLDLRGIAGGRVRSEATIVAIKAGSLAVGLCSVLALLIQAAFGHWSRTEVGLVAVLALVVLEAMMFVELQRKCDELLSRLRGAVGEEEVRDLLDPLEDEGWIVVHNWENPRGGNIDHIVIGKTGAFAIETKAGRYRSSAGGQAIGAAIAVRDLTGIGWVTAVACTAEEGRPTQKGTVWVVGPDALAEWLRSARVHRGRPINMGQARSRLRTHAGDGFEPAAT